ncbi:two pore domain potassium channel family protein, partial [Actinomadura adrarensis]
MSPGSEESVHNWSPERSEASLEAWRNRTIVPMVVAAGVFLGAYAWPIIDPGLPDGPRMLCEVAMTVVWVLFGADYLVRLWLSPRRWRFVWKNWFDLVVLAAPMLRSLRLVQVIMVLGLVNKHASASLRASVSRYSAAAAVLIVLCAAL